MKTIINLCTNGNKCILGIDGEYFGYDNHPYYPETLYKDIVNAYVFAKQIDALALTTWYPGRKFTLIPIK